MGAAHQALYDLISPSFLLIERRPGVTLCRPYAFETTRDRLKAVINIAKINLSKKIAGLEVRSPEVHATLEQTFLITPDVGYIQHIPR